MKHAIFISCIFILSFDLYAQQNIIPITDNLVVEDIPALASSYISDVKNYTESRSGILVSWHPTKKEMLISTRFANSNQLHHVKMPGGDRKQITFFDEPISTATFEPIKGDYFLFSKDNGGNEFSQIYSYDLSKKKITLLTDGKRSQNGGIKWNGSGDKIAYASTKRNGQDRDIYSMNPLIPESDKKLVENTDQYSYWQTLREPSFLLHQNNLLQELQMGYSIFDLHYNLLVLIFHQHQ